MPTTRPFSLGFYRCPFPLLQMLSIQDENVLPPQFQVALERVRAGADVMPRKQLEQASAGRGTFWSLYYWGGEGPQGLAELTPRL